MTGRSLSFIKFPALAPLLLCVPHRDRDIQKDHCSTDRYLGNELLSLGKCVTKVELINWGSVFEKG